MTPLNGVQRARLADLASFAAELGRVTAAGDLQSALHVIDTQAAVIARVNDGWEYARPGSLHEQGVWWRFDGDPYERMTPAEAVVIYGCCLECGGETSRGCGAAFHDLLSDEEDQ